MPVPVAARSRRGFQPVACWYLRFRIPLGAWMSVSCECCVLWGRGLCDDPITRPEESYRPWCIAVCDLENLVNEEPAPSRSEGPQKKKSSELLIIRSPVHGRHTSQRSYAAMLGGTICAMKFCTGSLVRSCHWDFLFSGPRSCYQPCKR